MKSFIPWSVCVFVYKKIYFLQAWVKIVLSCTIISTIDTYMAQCFVWPEPTDIYSKFMYVQLQPHLNS